MKCTLVPSDFFDATCAGDYLAQVVDLPQGSDVRSALIGDYGAYFVWAQEGDKEPLLLGILRDLPKCPDYNKILCSWESGELCLAIAQGRTLLLANTYKAADFVTAEYFIFLALKSLQLNPEISTICLRSEVSPEDKMSLYRYFKAVESL